MYFFFPPGAVETELREIKVDVTSVTVSEVAVKCLKCSFRITDGRQL